MRSIPADMLTSGVRSKVYDRTSVLHFVWIFPEAVMGGVGDEIFSEKLLKVNSRLCCCLSLFPVLFGRFVVLCEHSPHVSYGEVTVKNDKKGEMLVAA